ncbi:MAG: GTPase ObgE [Tenericutes bacterium]|nr:GTPase ObgE [Mycoplasmatota bacterium]
MFIDEVVLNVIGGKGGDGSSSFRHEKFIEMGGPDGGNGGRGGNVVFVADEGLKTLIDLRYQKKIKGEKGSNGSGANRTGASGEDTYVKVPVGTTITDTETNLIIADLVKDKEEAIIASGGRGGKGNAAFKSNKNKAPTTSEYGAPGEERIVKCELKLLADVGLVGFPSVGKSSLISVISASKPKIADYHFTTLTPNLGVVKAGDYSFVVADLPGIIEGASEGIGLGDKFLKHASRCKVIAYVIDMASTEGRDVIEEYEVLKKELKNYSEKLYNKKSIVIANKSDMPSFNENLEKFKKKYKDVEIITTSAITKSGLEDLKRSLAHLVKTTEEKVYEDKEFESYVLYEFKKEKPYTITKENDHTYVITGDKLELLLKMTRFNSDEAALKFARKLKNMGIDEELRNLGAKDGDTIRILDQEFEYSERLNY